MRSLDAVDTIHLDVAILHIEPHKRNIACPATPQRIRFDRGSPWLAIESNVTQLDQKPALRRKADPFHDGGVRDQAGQASESWAQDFRA